nr:hypothetical protein [Tanacetum cinerariifolium]
MWLDAPVSIYQLSSGGFKVIVCMALSISVGAYDKDEATEGPSIPADQDGPVGRVHGAVGYGQLDKEEWRPKIDAKPKVLIGSMWVDETH